MKNRLLFALFVCAAPLTVSAQYSSFAIKAGPTFGHFSGPGATYSASGSNGAGSFNGDQQIVVGYSLGVSYNAAINSLFSFNPELLYFQTGSKVAYSGNLLGTSYNGSSTVRINYFQLPLMFRLNLNGDNYNVYANIGPYLGYASGGKWKSEATAGGTTNTEERALNFSDDNIAHFDAGVAMGVGAGFRAGPGMLGFDLRFQQGLTRVQKDKPENDPDTDHDESKDVSYNQLFTPSLFYAFRF